MLLSSCVWKVCLHFFTSHVFLNEALRSNSHSASLASANDDRIKCIRQDNLDLMLGPRGDGGDDQIIRQVYGYPDSTKFDVVLTATGLQVKQLDATLLIQRSGSTSLEFVLGGSKTLKDKGGVSHGVGWADIWVKGIEVQSLSTLANLGASAAADTKRLLEGQYGTLYFSLSGTAAAQWNPELDKWETQLTSTKVDFFEFKFDGQWILQTALNEFGGVDKVILEGLFEVLKALIPPSFMVALHYLPTTAQKVNSRQDLWLSAEFALTGSMNKIDSPLWLSSHLIGSIHFAPASLLNILESFDSATFAMRIVDLILLSETVQMAWQSNRESFRYTLRRYGLLLSRESLEIVEKTERLSDLRPLLLETVGKMYIGFFDMVSRFIQAYRSGTFDALKGFRSKVEGRCGWRPDFNNGEIWAELTGSTAATGAEWSSRYVAKSGNSAAGSNISVDTRVELATLPYAFLQSLSLGFHPPSAGKTTSLTIADFDLEPSGISAREVSTKHFLYEFFGNNGTSHQLWEIENAKLRSLFIKLPGTFEQVYSLKCQFCTLDILQSGDVKVAVGPGGLTLREVKKAKPSSTRVLRSGHPTAFDGPLPEKFTRPLQVVKALKMSDASPFASGGVFVDTTGNDNQLSLAVRVNISTEIQLRSIMRSFFVARPREDFGYAFFAEKFKWVIDEKGVRDVFAVVSCGYLRLFRSPLYDDPKDLLRMDESKGQLEWDLAAYNESLDFDGECVKISVPAETGWTTGWFTKASSRVGKLCPLKPATIDLLLQALTLQLQRFRDRGAAENNFGTHSLRQAKFLLPEEKEPMSLYRILQAIESGGRNSGGSGLVQLDADDPSEPHRKQSGPLRTMTGNLVAGAMEGAAAVGEAAGAAGAAVVGAIGGVAGHTAVGVVAAGGMIGTPVSQAVRGGRNLTRFALGIEEFEPSPDSAACRAQEDLDRIFFPPEEHPNYAIRLVFPSTPIGDVHVLINQLHILNVSMQVKLQRESDDTFSFEVFGDKDGPATLHAYVEGFHLLTPSSPIDALAGLASGFERVMTFVGTLGIVQDGGRLDKGPVKVKLRMKGNFKLDRAGRWQVVKGAYSRASVKFGTGGIVQAIVNKLIKAYGDMDEIFFQYIWPLLSSVIPARWGKAFSAVPLAASRIKHQLRIEGNCAKPYKSRTCPDGLLLLNIEDITNIKAAPKPIIKEYIGADLDNYTLLSSILSAYNSGSDVLRESAAFADIAMRYYRLPRLSSTLEADNSRWAQTFRTIRDPLALGISADFLLPFSFIKGLFGASAFTTALDFIPDPGRLVASGTINIDGKNGIATVPSLRADNIRMPFSVATTSGLKTDAFEVSFVVEDVKARRLQPEGRLADMNFSLPYFDIGLDRSTGLVSGLPSSPGAQKAQEAIVTVGQRTIDETLQSIVPSLVLPNVRDGPTGRPDGVVPKEFRRKFAIQPAVLDPKSLLESLHATATFSSVGNLSSAQEVVDIQIKVKGVATLSIGTHLYRQLLDSTIQDTGFIHFAISGVYGQITRGRPPSESAMLDMGCGKLTIYKTGNGNQPYHDVLDIVELAEVMPYPRSQAAGSLMCLSVKMVSVTMVFVFGTEVRYFCGTHLAIGELERAITLQVQRFTKGQEASREADRKDAACDTGEAACVGPRKPVRRDTTWYRRHNPYDTTSWYPQMALPERPDDVESPAKRWTRVEGTRSRLSGRGSSW